ncbi:hypothetical protein [Thiolapillus sp.]
MYPRFILIVFAAGLVGGSIAAEPSLQELKNRCEAAREARLAPEREALIQACIEEKKKSAEQCQRFYADYGAGGRTAAGAGRVRKYNNLPECEALYRAEKGDK